MGDGQPGASKKRPADGTPRGDASQHKRNKINAARNIPAQPAEAALKDGELDLQAFVAAHEFEIRSLQQSMATSKAVSASRAFQQVPRGLRRRTASHNPKRVPKRQRARARKEMAEDNTPLVEARRRKPKTTRARIRAETAKRLGILAKRKEKKRAKAIKELKNGLESQQGTVEGHVTPTPQGVVGRKPRPKIRRDALNDPPQPAAKFKKRQLNKTWLPTHTWHAKRARMTEPKTPLWGFATPLTPNEKIYRPTHRAQGNRGAISWDTSYFSTIGLFGNLAGVERVLRQAGVVRETCWNEKGQKWRAGTRSWTGMLSKQSVDDRRDMAIATVVWNPLLSTELEGESASHRTPRQVFVRVHPSAFLEVFTELVRLTKMTNPRVHVEDLRFEIGSVELTGPASTDILHAVLTPYGPAHATEANHVRLFRAISGLTNAASLPVNAILGFSVQDPRLRFPPRKAIDRDAGQGVDDVMLETLAEWPAGEQLGPYAIFDRDARHKASGLPTQKFVNRRRGSAPPGTQLKPTKSDPRIPILLLASRSGTGTQMQGNWTLLAPWTCIQHFWHSIVRCPLSSGGNPRFGGLNEIRQVAFERGQPWFPGDYMATQAGMEWELAERQKRKRAWDRKPKSKRPEWSSLDLGGGRKGEIGDGLACDYEALFNLQRSASTIEHSTSKDADAMDVDDSNIEENGQHDVTSVPLEALRAITKASFGQLLRKESTDEPPCNTVVTARIKFHGTGVAKSLARVYRLPTKRALQALSADAEVPATIPPLDSSSSPLPHDMRQQWLARARSTSRSKSATQKATRPTDVESRKRILAQELTAPWLGENPPASSTLDGEGHHLLVPDREDLIGFVTTGSFSLSEGHGFAIASLAVDKVVPGLRESPEEGQICIVRNAGESVGWLARWEAV